MVGRSVRVCQYFSCVDILLRVLIMRFLLYYRISATTLATHPLVAASLSGLNIEETFDAAVDGTQLL